MTVWHGTLDQFDQFSEGDIGFHFSKDRRVALNRISDKMDDFAAEFPYSQPLPIPVLLKVELDIHSPLNLNSDIEDWTALGILTTASFILTKKPFESSSSIPLTRQRAMSHSAMSVLKTLQIDKESALKTLSQIQANPALNPEYTLDFRTRSAHSPHDAIIYPNEHESEDGIDPLCIIIPDSDAISIIERIPISIEDL